MGEIRSHRTGCSAKKKKEKKAKLYGWGGEKGSGKVGPGREEAKQLRGTKRSLTEGNPGSEDYSIDTPVFICHPLTAAGWESGTMSGRKVSRHRWAADSDNTLAVGTKMGREEMRGTVSAQRGQSLGGEGRWQ